ncbi:endosomal transmembrane epsin interactor 1 isoform X3 [Pogona vitticeps]|uniref:Endosomal transmembrane epsin interactor 1 isoform X4 n=1 Tax=Pogona vitticeps TaxID=103695 RepID=A0ABM5FSB6_9SAUR
MSLPVVLPGSCCPMARLSGVPEAARHCSVAAAAAAAAAAAIQDPSQPPPPIRPRWSRGGLQQPRPRPAALSPEASRRAAASSSAGPRLLLPARPLLSLGLLQLILGCCMVALSFGALSLSSSPQVKNSCPFWAGSSVILSGIIGLTTWKRPMILLKVLFALCALNALTTTVCLVAAALRYLQIFATRRSGIEESQVYAGEVEEQSHASDAEDFVPPIPPPSYFATFYSCTPRMSRRMLDSDVIPLPHIYGARIKGVEVFCPLDPPPPYEAVVSQLSHEQEGTSQISDVTESVNSPAREDDTQESEENEGAVSSSIRETTLHPDPSPSSASAGTCKRNLKLLRKRSKSDPVLHNLPPRGLVLSCEAATQTELKPELATVILRKTMRAKALRSRPQSLIDYKSYIDTKLLVAKFLEQSSCSMTPDIHELVEDIKSVLKSDEEHMEEAITSASFLEQVMTPALPSTSRAHTLPFRRHPGLLHLESCGDVSTFTTAKTQLLERRTQRLEHERPHSLIGVVRETVL